MKEGVLKMKNNEILLTALNGVNDEFIPLNVTAKENAENTENMQEDFAEMRIVTPKKSAKGKWAALSGGCAAVVAGALVLNGIHQAAVNENKRLMEALTDYRIYSENLWETKTEKLPLITSHMFFGGGYAGFDINDISELDSSSPLPEDTYFETLPVFLNLSYTEIGTSISNPQPFFYTEEQLNAMGEKIVHLLNLTVKESYFSYNDTYSDKPYGIDIICESDKYLGSGNLDRLEPLPENEIRINIYGDGSIHINIADADKYPESEFRTLLQYLNPVYENNRHIYDKGDSLTEELLNYCFAYSDVTGGGISMNNLLSASEYVGDYPIISPEQAREQFLQGDFITSVPDHLIIKEGEGDREILKTELIYRTDNSEKYRQPYYQITAVIKDGIDQDSIHCGIFYVPAVHHLYRTTEEELKESNPIMPTVTEEPKVEDSALLNRSAPYLGEGNGLIYAENFEELESMNPVSEDSELDTLPVYRDLSYNPSGSPVYFTEEQFNQMAEQAAAYMHYAVRIKESVCDDYGITAVITTGGYGMQEAVLRITADGTLEVLFGDEAAEAAEAAGLSVNTDYLILLNGNFNSSAELCSKEEAKNAIDFLLQDFDVLTDYKNCTVEIRSVRPDAESGTQWRFGVFDSSNDLVQTIVNYNLNYTVFTPGDKKNSLASVKVFNRLSVSEYVGDYKIITLGEAMDKMFMGEYFTNAPEEKLSGDALYMKSISHWKFELVYLSEGELLVPYYRILVEMTGKEGEYAEIFVSAIEADAENENKPNEPEDDRYKLIGAYLNEENEVCVDFTGMSASEDYELFRKYFFGVWDSPDGYLPWSLTIDDSENINFGGRGFYGEFYQPGDSVIAFTLHTNGDAHVLWLDMANPDIMYTAVFLMTNGLGVFTLEGITSDVHALTKNDAAPSEPADGFLSIFKLHEMARDYGMDFDLLTNIDYGFIDGTYYLHSATYDFYPMYLVSETDDKIVIRTSVGNVGSTDLKPIDVICTFERVDGEWNRNVDKAAL